MFTQHGVKKVDITFTRDRKVQLLHFGNLGLLDFVFSIFGGGIDEQLSYDSSLNVWYSIIRWGWRRRHKRKTELKFSENLFRQSILGSFGDVGDTKTYQTDSANL